jgi:hypothetical protein
VTEAEIRQQVVDTIFYWKGKNEADGTFKSIIDLYNSYLPHPRGYAMPYDAPWCATTASAVAIATKLTAIIPVECSCNEMIRLFKTHKYSRFEEDDSYSAKPADFIFYDWDDNGVGDCTGEADHVGIVVTNDGQYMGVIEGNAGNGIVTDRYIPINGKCIRGFGLPAYDVMATENTSNPKMTIEAARKIVEKAIADLQQILR